MEYALKHRQQGYLLVLAIVLVTIMSFVALIMTRLVSNEAKMSANLTQSKQALYLAVSGLEIAKHDLTQSGVQCGSMGSNHSAESLFTGQFSVSGLQTTASSTLASDISSNSTSLVLNSTGGFAPIGLVKIDGEYIYYASVSGNVLGGLSRGKAGSTASSHLSGAVAYQSQCYISSTGAIPSMASATAVKSTVGGVVWMASSLSLGGYAPGISSANVISVKGNGTIINPDPSVVFQGANFAGSTAVSTVANGVTFSGSGSTQVNDSSGNLTTSSDKKDILADVTISPSLSTSLFQSYFGPSATPASMQALATSQGQYYASFNQTAINGVTNKVIWVNGNASLSGNLTVGSVAQPVVMIVNGDLSVSNGQTFTMYGILYVMGKVDVGNGNATITGEGSLGAEGTITIGPGNPVVSMSVSPGDQVINSIYTNLVTGGGTSTFITKNTGIQVVYP